MNSLKLSTTLLSLSLLLMQGTVPVLADSSTDSSEQLGANLKFNRWPVKPSMTEENLQAAIAKIDKLAQKQIDEGAVPGMAIAIVHNDKVLFARGYGLREVGKPEKVDPDTVFQLASI
ncbi:MAG TPA: serine hydrolase domain-containing protein, partial [Chroococcales cyanobacterium]